MVNGYIGAHPMAGLEHSGFDHSRNVKLIDRNIAYMSAVKP